MDSLPLGSCSTKHLLSFFKKNGFSDEFLRELEEHGPTAVIERDTMHNLIISLDEIWHPDAPVSSQPTEPTEEPAARKVLPPVKPSVAVSGSATPRLRLLGASDLISSSSKNALIPRPPPRRVVPIPVGADVPVKPGIVFETARDQMARYDDIAKHLPSFGYSKSVKLTVSGHARTGAVDRGGSPVLPDLRVPMPAEEDPPWEPQEKERRAKKTKFNPNPVLAVHASPQIRSCLEDIIASKVAKEEHFKLFKTHFVQEAHNPGIMLKLERLNDALNAAGWTKGKHARAKVVAYLTDSLTLHDTKYWSAAVARFDPSE